jgi:quercetin dioxygenase-like cupin family protein
MAKPGDVFEVPELDIAFEIRQTAESTDGEYSEIEVTGNSRGFLKSQHVHTGVSERIEVLEGVLNVKLHGRTHTLHPGESIVIPPDTPHYQRGSGTGPGRLRIRHSPAGRIDEFAERLAQMSQDHQFNRLGFPKPRAAARFITDLGDAGHAARPSLKTQQHIAKAILAVADNEYTFVDEWDVQAPPEAVFDVLADGTTYPDWWKPVYIDATDDGTYTHQHFKGRLPYHLHTRTKTVVSDRPHRIQGETDGDLRGTGIWTLTATPTGTHVRFDWRVHADRRLLKLLTPILRPALRWNHNWAIARAIEGLEPYARQRTKVAA